MCFYPNSVSDFCDLNRSRREIDKQSSDSFQNFRKKKERGYNKLLHTPIEQGTSKKTTQNSSTTDCNDDHAV
jgi:hypothetical protein